MTAYKLEFNPKFGLDLFFSVQILLLAYQFGHLIELIVLYLQISYAFKSCLALIEECPSSALALRSLCGSNQKKKALVLLQQSCASACDRPSEAQQAR